MGTGCPVISTTCASLAEVVGDAALTLDDPHDHRRMADMLYTVLTDGTTAADLRRCGLSRAKEFSPEIALRRVAEVYRSWPEVCAHPSRSPLARPTLRRSTARRPRSFRAESSARSGFGGARLRRLSIPDNPFPCEKIHELPLSFPRGYGSSAALRNGSASISIALTASSCTACGCIRTGPFSRLADGHACPTSFSTRNARTLGAGWPRFI